MIRSVNRFAWCCAMAEAPAPLVLTGKSGLDNRARETELGDVALRVCDNLDISNGGSLRCRAGLRVVSGSPAHSLFTHPSRLFFLAAVDGELVRIDRNEGMTPLAPVAAPVVYTVLNDDVFWSDGHSIGQVLSTGAAGQWGLAVPPVPVVSAVAHGGLHAGTYQIAMTAIRSSGLESGAAETVSVEVPTGGGIQVTTPDATGVVFAFYRTPANGSRDELRSAIMVIPGETVVIGNAPLGRILESLHAVPPLPGQHLLAYKGRLWGASGKVLWFTSERSPHWVFPATGYYQFESAVTMLGAAEDGIYVGLYDRVYYLQGADPAKMTQRPVSSVGAVAGSAAEIPYDLFVGQGSFPSRQCAWWDADGFLCVGKPGGIVVRPTQDRYSAGEVTSGAMAYRRFEGMRQLVAGLQSDPAPALRASDTAVQTIFSNGVILNAG
jgi:hypothetical protein